MYQMPKQELQKLLKIASDQVPFGVFAIEKGDYAELRNDQCKSITQLKSLIRQFRQQGYKVHANGK